MPTTDQFSYNAIVTSMCGMASVCLVVYDQIATLPDEVEYIWRRKFSSVKLLFLMNRLALLLWASAQGYINYGAYVTFSLVWWGGQETLVWSMGCTIMQNLGLASQVLMIIIQAAFIAIRAYALTGGRWIISIAVSILGISPISNYIISTPFIKNVMPADRILGSAAPICSSSPLKPLESSGRNSVINCALGAWVSTAGILVSALADLIVIVVTYLKARKTARLLSQMHGSGSLTPILLRNGIIQFTILVSLNLLGLVTRTMDPFWSSTWDFTYLLTFQTPLQAIIVSHFLLSVREAAHAEIAFHPGVDSHYAFPSLQSSNGLGLQQSGLRFASFVGPMGGPLDTGFDEELDDDDVSGSDDGIRDDESLANEEAIQGAKE